MAVTSAQVTVSDTAIALNTESGPVAGTRLVIKNVDETSAVALGDASVTALTGFQLAAGASVTLDLSGGEQIYAIRVTGDVIVHVLSTG